MGGNVVLAKSFDFAVRIVNLSKYLMQENDSLYCQCRFCGVEWLLVAWPEKLSMLGVGQILFTNYPFSI